MSAKVARILLILLMGIHFCLAAWFASITPYRTGGILLNQRGENGQPQTAKDIGAPDERQHANYIRYLLAEGKLPVFDPKSPNFYEEYQSHQPPLFYALSATSARLTGQTDVESQAFGRTIRILNCLIGAVGVAGVFFAGARFSKREEVGVIAAAFAALLPMNVALSGAISNDPLLITLISWSMALLLGNFVGSSWKSFVLPGFLIGLALITKSSGLVILLIGGLGLFWTGKNAEGDPKQRALGAVIAVLIALLIVAPVWIRNQSLYGDPLAQSAFRGAFIGSAQKSTIIERAIIPGPGAGSPEVQYWINWIGYWTARSFIGVFGYMDIWINDSGRAIRESDPNLIYKAIILLNFAGVFGGLAWIRSNWQATKRNGVLILGLLGLTLALFVMFTNTYFQAQARYLLPALAAWATLMATGWLQIFRKWAVALAVVVLVFGGFTVYAGTQLPGEFAKRATISSP